MRVGIEEKEKSLEEIRMYQVASGSWQVNQVEGYAKLLKIGEQRGRIIERSRRTSLPRP